MAVTVGQLAVELRLATDPAATVEEPLNGVLSRVLATAQRLVADRATDSAPEALTDEATIAVASYLYDRPSASAGSRFANVMRNSGALSILTNYISRRAGIIGASVISG